MDQRQQDELDLAFRTQARTEKAWTLFMALIAAGSSSREAISTTEDAINTWIGYEDEHMVRIPFLGTGDVFYPSPPGLMDVRVLNQKPSTPPSASVPAFKCVFSPGPGTISGSIYGNLLWPVMMEKDNGAASYPVVICWDLESAQRVSDALNDAKANGHLLNLNRLGKQ